MINYRRLGLVGMVGGWAILKTTVYSTINTGSPSAIESGAWGRKSMFHWEIQSILTKAGLLRLSTALFQEPFIPPLGNRFFWATNNVERNPKSRGQVCSYCSDAENRIVNEISASDYPGKVALDLSWALRSHHEWPCLQSLIWRILWESARGMGTWTAWTRRDTLISIAYSESTPLNWWDLPPLDLQKAFILVIVVLCLRPIFTMKCLCWVCKILL
jgi:hypothetical protein